MQQYQELTQNQIKMLKSLKKKSGRDEHRLFIAEGFKICNELTNNSLYKPDFLIIPGNVENESLELAQKISSGKLPIYKAKRSIFDKLCDTKTPQDILAVIRQTGQKPIINEPFIALDNISDPGNVGTIIRTAEWFGFRQIILGEGCADMYNPKTVRSTMGSLFRLNLIATSNLTKYISENFAGYSIYGTFLNGDIDLSKCSPPAKFGIIFGNESAGISPELHSIIDYKIKIKGKGNAESLNVSIATGICLHELSRKNID